MGRILRNVVWRAPSRRSHRQSARQVSQPTSTPTTTGISGELLTQFRCARRPVWVDERRAPLANRQSTLKYQY